MSYIIIDVDECKEELDDCEQICLNHIGHHVCECKPGCELQADNTTCLGTAFDTECLINALIDVNECEESTSGCNQICTNKHCLDGRYECSCHDNYLMSDNNHTCLGKYQF